MNESDSVSRADSSRNSEPGNRNLVLRIFSAAVLAPLMLSAAYIGGWPFGLFWSLAALAVLWEWITLVGGTARPMRASSHSLWVASGLIYAVVMALAPVLLRADESDGMPALMFLLAIVWTTDVLAYFAGRALGGPKLCPAISPQKTWSGAVAGLLGAVVAGVGMMSLFGSFNWVALAIVGFLLSVAAQLGDLFESAIKRRFGVKDSSHLIPGHGGFMDRLDSFWAAAVLACSIGIIRGGVDGAAHGLLVWR